MSVYSSGLMPSEAISWGEKGLSEMVVMVFYAPRGQMIILSG
jgi:hypothetical protein